jgi:hypothetical protein
VEALFDDHVPSRPEEAEIGREERIVEKAATISGVRYWRALWTH